MSSNFLNRRMDLFHRILDGYNVFEMDTSYPVKLAGKVIKLFDAGAIYDPTMGYKLTNTDREVMLTITPENVYDFAGRVIKDSIGEGCVYPLASDVYKQGDYVMAILDFDTSKLLLCSQTNFENMLGSGEGRLRIFTLDGDVEPTEYDSGIEYDYDRTAFDEAAAFEEMEGRNALAKFTTDEVIYETPKSTWYDSHHKNRSIIPVAKTEVENIGTNLTARLNKFMFTYLDNLGGDNGTSYINKIAAFVQIFGSLNSSFIEDYCMSESEMLKSKLISTATTKMKKAMLEEYYNIPSIYRNKYRYILMCNTDTDNFNFDKYDTSMKFIPFDINSGTFPSLFMLNNRGLIAGGESVELPGYLRVNGNDYVGQLEYNDARQGYTVVHFSTKIDFLIPKYDDNDNLKGTINDNTLSTAEGPKIYMSRNDSILVTGINYSSSMDKDSFTSYLTSVNQFVNFFLPVTYISDIRADVDKNIYKHVLGFQNSTYDYTHYCTVMGSNVLPNTVVVEYPAMFESYLGTSANITNYVESGIPSFNRKNLSFANRVSPNNYEHVEGIVFKLFNTKASNAYIESNNGGKSATLIYRPASESEQPVTINNPYRFKATRSLSYNSDASNQINNGIYADSDNRNFVFAPICITSVNALKTRDNFEVDYNPVEVTASNIMVVKKIKNAADNLTTNADGELMYGSYPLYIIVKYEDGDITDDVIRSITIGSDIYMIKYAVVGDVKTAAGFKKQYTNWKGDFLYMYYVDYSDRLHRIKYHYRNANGIIDDFDYFTDNVVCNFDDFGVDAWRNPAQVTEYDLDVLDKMDKSNIYVKAFFNAKATEDYNRDTLAAIRQTPVTDWSIYTLPLYVDAYYGLYTSVNQNPPANYGNDDILIKTSSKLLSVTSNFNLTVGIDEIIVFPGTNNNKNIYGIEGIRLSDMFKSSSVTIQKNMMAPIVSDKKDINGGYVYNIANYLSIAKRSNASTIGTGNWMEFNIHKTINVNGITIPHNFMLDFFQYALTHDLGNSNTTTNPCFDKVEIYDRALFKKTKIINGIKFKLNNGSSAYANATWDIYDANDNPTSISASNNDGVVLHTNLNPKDIMGVGTVTMNTQDGTDYSYHYIDESVMSLVNATTTGKKKTYSISLNDTDNELEPNMVSIDGSSDLIETDEISTQSLLNAISGNKSLDILSYSLRTIKTVLNTEIVDSIQNISDTITMNENKATIQTATRTDAHPHASEAGMAPYLIPAGEPWAEFNEDICVYNFHFAYGYLSPTHNIYNEHRVLNNRGVIVFVTENGDSYRQAGSGDIYDVYSNKLPDIHPKRMYINNDGVLCTKEYFDREEAIYSDTTKYPSGYPAGTSIAELHEIISNLTTQVADLTSRLEAIERELHPNP